MQEEEKNLLSSVFRLEIELSVLPFVDRTARRQITGGLTKAAWALSTARVLTFMYLAVSRATKRNNEPNN
jgi:hypothetical protein